MSPKWLQLNCLNAVQASQFIVISNSIPNARSDPNDHPSSSSFACWMSEASRPYPLKDLEANLLHLKEIEGQRLKQGATLKSHWLHLLLYSHCWVHCQLCQLSYIYHQALRPTSFQYFVWWQLTWARNHPHSQEAKSLNAKVSWILLMVGSTIPYSPF